MKNCTNCEYSTTRVFDYPCSICDDFENFTEKTKYVSVKETNLQIVRDILSKHFDATGNEYNEAANEIIESLNL